MKRRRQKNLSTGAIVAIVVAGVVLVPVTLAAAGVYALHRVAKKAIDEILRPENMGTSGTLNEYSWTISQEGSSWIWGVDHNGVSVAGGATASELGAKQAVRDTLLALGVQG